MVVRRATYDMPALLQVLALYSTIKNVFGISQVEVRLSTPGGASFTPEIGYDETSGFSGAGREVEPVSECPPWSSTIIFMFK